MRSDIRLFLFLAIISSGTAAAFFATAEQGSWSLIFPMPWAPQPAVASIEAATEKEGAAPGVAVLRGQTIGDWTATCGLTPQSSTKQCTIAQQFTDKRIRSAFFAGLVADDGDGDLVADRRTLTGVFADRWVVVDGGTLRPMSVPSTSCTRGHCEAVTNLAPDFVNSHLKATWVAASLAVSGDTLTSASVSTVWPLPSML